MQEKYPSFKWVKLLSPVAIHVANEDAGLQDVGMKDVRIDWGPGKYSVHTMSVVPKLSFPVLFGKAPVKRSKLFTQQHTTFVYHLLHVVACCCMLLYVVVLGSGQTHQTFCPTLYNFIIFCGLSDQNIIAHRGIIRRNLLTNIIPVRSYSFDQ